VHGMPRFMSTFSIVIGVLAVILGVTVYLMVHFELADQKITVSEDAPFLAGDEVDGPFSAYAEAMAINEHALDAGGGRTYAEIPSDDPARQTVMTADFLQASLFTSVVAFGVAALVTALGVVMILLGFAFRELDRRTQRTRSPLAVPDLTPEGIA
jgi:predicted PurR-regulated permease PerM